MPRAHVVFSPVIKAGVDSLGAGDTFEIREYVVYYFGREVCAYAGQSLQVAMDVNRRLRYVDGEAT